MNNNRKNFKTYLQNGTFYIPIYQRKFIWNKENIFNFLNEVFDLFDNFINSGTKKEIFAGTIFIKKNEENCWDLIDGQQRTTFLFGFKISLLDSMKEILNKTKNENYEKNISKVEKRTIIDKFEKIINVLEKFDIQSASGDLEKQIKNKKSRTIKLFDKINEKINEYFEENEIDDPKDKMTFFNLFFENVEIVQVEVKDTDDINEIFKSINSKGRKLDNWDLIRNEIFKKVKLNNNNENEAKKELNEIDENLQNINNEYSIKPEEFIQSFLLLKRKKYIKNKDLSIEFSKSHDKKEFKISNLLDEIKSFKNKNSSDENSEIKWFLYILKEFRARQIKIIFLAILLKENLKNDKFEFLRKLFLNFVLYVNVFNGRGNVFEIFFIKNIVNILDLNKNEINNSDFFKANNEKINSLSENELLNEMDENKNLLKLYIWFMTPNSEKSNIYKKLNYQHEHVLPIEYKTWKNKYDFWKKIDENVIKDEYLEKIGNIILIHKKMNASIKNNIFEKNYMNIKIIKILDYSQKH